VQHGYEWTFGIDVGHFPAIDVLIKSNTKRGRKPKTAYSLYQEKNSLSRKLNSRADSCFLESYEPNFILARLKSSINTTIILKKAVKKKKRDR